MPRKDPEARKAYHREYMRKRLAEDPEFKARHHSRVRKNNEINLQRIKTLVAEFRSNGCAKCGETTPVCLDAHHVDPAAKEFTISRSSWWRMAKDIESELTKCVCLCKNCHAKLHAGLMGL